MPGNDQTGPVGEGPMTGRALGDCVKKLHEVQGNGLGRDLGRGLGCNRGLGKRFRKGAGRNFKSH